MKRSILFGLVFCALIFNTNLVMGEDNMISTGKTVKFDYTLTVNDEVIDSSQGKEPLEYVQGEKMIIPGLEAGMEGMKAGDKKKIVIAADDAYGPVDERAVVEIPKAQLGEGVDPQVGMMLQLTTAEGQPVPGQVVEIKEESIVVDFNHPLAGKDLTFDVEVIEVK